MNSCITQKHFLLKGACNFHTVFMLNRQTWKDGALQDQPLWTKLHCPHYKLNHWWRYV